MTQIDQGTARSVAIYGLPKLRTFADLANELRVSQGVLYRMMVKSEFFYREFSVLKKDGSFRNIAHPSHQLKAIQGWILRHILDAVRPSNAAKGFEKGSSIADNASVHVGARAVLTVDLLRFFENISARRVFGIFCLIGYNQAVAACLTRICTLRNALPQGAPTSPKLANLISYALDQRLTGWAGRRGLVYSRYADDITISGHSQPRVSKALAAVEAIVQDEGFKLNHLKTRVAGAGRPHRVNGLVVTHDAFGIGRLKLRELRVRIHHWIANRGADETEKSKIEGILAYVADVDKVRLGQLRSYTRRLEGRLPLVRNKLRFPA